MRITKLAPDITVCLPVGYDNKAQKSENYTFSYIFYLTTLRGVAIFGV